MKRYLQGMSDPVEVPDEFRDLRMWYNPMTKRVMVEAVGTIMGLDELLHPKVRKKPSKRGERTSRYKGVFLERTSGLWAAVKDGKRRRFTTEEAAAQYRSGKSPAPGRSQSGK